MDSYSVVFEPLGGKMRLRQEMDGGTDMQGDSWAGRKLNTPEERSSFQHAFYDTVYQKAYEFSKDGAHAALLTDRVFRTMEQRFETCALPSDCKIYLAAQVCLLYARYGSDVNHLKAAEQSDMQEKASAGSAEQQADDGHVNTWKHGNTEQNHEAQSASAQNQKQDVTQPQRGSVLADERNSAEQSDFRAYTASMAGNTPVYGQGVSYGAAGSVPVGQGAFYGAVNNAPVYGQCAPYGATGNGSVYGQSVPYVAAIGVPIYGQGTFVYGQQGMPYAPIGCMPVYGHSMPYAQAGQMTGYPAAQAQFDRKQASSLPNKQVDYPVYKDQSTSAEPSVPPVQVAAQESTEILRAQAEAAEILAQAQAQKAEAERLLKQAEEQKAAIRTVNIKQAAQTQIKQMHEQTSAEQTQESKKAAEQEEQAVKQADEAVYDKKATRLWLPMQGLPSEDDLDDDDDDDDVVEEERSVPLSVANTGLFVALLLSIAFLLMEVGVLPRLF